MNEQQPTPTFSRVAPGVDLPELDARVLDLWDRIGAFHTSVEQRPLESEYTFYDGPPFATGSPHYGHILQGVVKDIVPRYWTMRGHRVERRFGWDTHGLPVEMEVQKLLGVSGPREIEELGVAKFNETARELVNHTATDWYDITRRIGRWVDFDDDYKTMDVTFMESVWWGFKQLWDRGLIYKAFKVLPYSWGATTSLSNFEVNLGGYRDVEDPSITLRLAVTEGNEHASVGDYLLVWTTTPWTLPGNLGVSVGPDIEYARVLDDGDHYWVARERIDTIWPEDPPPVVGMANRQRISSASATSRRSSTSSRSVPMEPSESSPWTRSRPRMEAAWFIRPPHTARPTSLRSAKLASTSLSIPSISRLDSQARSLRLRAFT